MLIEKPIAKGEAIVMKMANSEEIIAKLDSMTADTITVTHALTLAPGQGGIQLMPWFMMRGHESQVRIDRRHVICHGRPFESLEKTFLEQTSTIQRPGPASIH
jgi:hypothetical protein